MSKIGVFFYVVSGTMTVLITVIVVIAITGDGFSKERISAMLESSQAGFEVDSNGVRQSFTVSDSMFFRKKFVSNPLTQRSCYFYDIELFNKKNNRTIMIAISVVDEIKVGKYPFAQEQGIGGSALIYIGKNQYESIHYSGKCFGEVEITEVSDSLLSGKFSGRIAERESIFAPKWDKYKDHFIDIKDGYFEDVPFRPGFIDLR